MFWGIDYYYFILVVPALLISIWAQVKVKSTFHRCSQVFASRGLTGAEAAEEVLRMNGVNGVQVERVAGNLTDHYDPRTNVIRLSDGVYGSSSVAAIGVAAHEAGHAAQYASNYLPIRIRTAIIPITNFGSALSMPLLLAGLLMGYAWLVQLGILLFSAVTVFQLVTLPVELNASSRAIRALRQGGVLTEQELPYAKKTLTAAAMTYVAALLTSLAQLLRLLLLFGNRRD